MGSVMSCPERVVVPAPPGDKCPGSNGEAH